ncbi:MAG: rhomboid family intramembrane serine protease, partial [Deltaproteobacteria bacterium]
MPRGQPTMSGFGVPPLTRGVKWLGVITLAVSILIRVFGDAGHEFKAAAEFVPAALAHGRVWQLVTYTFINTEPFNLIFALLGLWMIGGMLEREWGTRRFIIFYFLTSVAGALATAAIGIFSETVAHFGYTGNWSAIEGLIAAFAVVMPNAQILLYLFPVQAKWMLPISAGITVLFMLMTGWQPYLPQLFGLGAGVLFAGGVSPGNVFLRAKVWWIDRRLRR